MDNLMFNNIRHHEAEYTLDSQVSTLANALYKRKETQT